MCGNRGIAEADAAQNELASFALELGDRRITQGRRLWQLRGGKHAESVMGEPEEITGRGLAPPGVARGNRLRQRIGENRLDELLDFVEEDLREFSILKMTVKRQTQLLVRFLTGATGLVKKPPAMPRTNMTRVSVEGGSARNRVRPGSASQTSANMAA